MSLRTVYETRRKLRQKTDIISIDPRSKCSTSYVYRFTCRAKRLLFAFTQLNTVLQCFSCCLCHCLSQDGEIAARLGEIAALRKKLDGALGDGKVGPGTLQEERFPQKQTRVLLLVCPT